MQRLAIREVIVVEGRYDRDTVLQAVDALVIETDGFGIFSRPEKLALLRRLQSERGLILMTDSDGAGFLIRGHLGGMLPAGVRQAYIPDIFGKEKRKCCPSRERQLGVEGMTPAIVREALLRAGATPVEGSAGSLCSSLTKADLYADGLSGRPGSAKCRARLSKMLGMPERMSANALLAAVNVLLTHEAYREAVRTLHGDETELRDMRKEE